MSRHFHGVPFQSTPFPSQTFSSTFMPRFLRSGNAGNRCDVCSLFSCFLELNRSESWSDYRETSLTEKQSNCGKLSPCKTTTPAVLVAVIMIDVVRTEAEYIPVEAWSDLLRCLSHSPFLGYSTRIAGQNDRPCQSPTRTIPCR